MEVLGLDGFEVGFSGQEPPQPAVSVFDAAFLPGSMGIAEVGLEAERMQQEVACELGAGVEGEGPAQVSRHHVEQASQMLGDEVCGFVFRPRGEQDAGASLVEG